MTTIHIPESRAERENRVKSLSALATATGWELAALLATDVRIGEGAGSRTDLSELTGAYTPNQFAAKGFRGLRSKNTIAAYVQHWLDAHDGQYPTPGSDVVLPKVDFPPTGDDSVARTVADPEKRDRLLEAGKAAGLPTGAKVLDVVANQKALAVAIEHDPETAKAAKAALDRRSEAELREAIIKHGGDPDAPDPRVALGMDAVSMDAQSLALRFESYIADLRKILNRAEPDQRVLVVKRFEEVISKMSDALYGKVPDTLEGLVER
jgi:hypothetical protein